VSSKKRSSGKRKSRQGLSGNPQRRAQQLGQDRRSGRDLSAFRHPLTDQDRAALRELARSAATALVGDDGDDSAVEDDEPAANDDEAPFRRHE
jgi:hypothetical protein